MGMMMIVVWCQHQVVMVEIVAASQVNARKERGTVIQPVTVMETLCVALTTAKLFPGDRSSFEDTDDCCYMPVCDGGDSCCVNGICGEGEGDCDSNSDCNSNLVCGKDNCKTGFPGDRSSFEDTDDCCMVPNSGCDGGDDCCKDGNCGEGQGDCDSDSDCYGPLVCGCDNCKTGWSGDRSSFEDNDDCCMIKP